MVRLLRTSTNTFMIQTKNETILKNYCIFLIRKPEFFIHHKLKRLRQMLSCSIHLAKVKSSWNFPDICEKSFPNINSPKYVKLRNGPWQIDTLKERGSLDGVRKKRKNSHCYERLKYINSIYTLYANVSLFNRTQIWVTNRVINDFSAFKSFVLFFSTYRSTEQLLPDLSQRGYSLLANHREAVVMRPLQPTNHVLSTMIWHLL